MSNLRTEPIPYENRDRVLGLELDDGTFLKNYGVDLQIDDGTPFTLELFNDPYAPLEYDALGNDELVEITPEKIQRLYDDGRLTIID